MDISVPADVEPQITILWLVESPIFPDVARIALEFGAKHVQPNPLYPAAAVALALGSGPVLAVVQGDAEATRVLGMGVDEVVRIEEVETPVLARALERTRARARGRELRDFYLVDLIRRDDSSALEMLSSAVGRQLLAPLVHALDDSEVLVRELSATAQGLNLGAGASEPSGRSELRRRAEAIATTLRRASSVAGNLDALIDSEVFLDVVDARTILSHAAEMLRPSVEQVATLTVELPDIECPVGMPRWQLVQLFASLIGNAVEALVSKPRDEARIEVRLLLHKDHASEIAELHVSDNGSGMDPAVRARAMDPFFSTRGADRTGLGLVLARSRVQRAGGDLLIDTEPSVGTCVQVFLPVRDQRLEASFSGAS